MATLFAIGEDLAAWHALLDERDGDISDPQIAALVDAWFADLASAEATKLDGYVGLVRQNEMEAAAAKEEAERWAKRAAARENAAKRLKERMKVYLELTGRTKVQTAAGRTVAVQANGGKAPLVLDPSLDPAVLPREFQRVTVAPDNDAIRAAIEAGGSLAFARLEPRGSHLRIR